MRPEKFVNVVIQNMVLVSQAQLFEREVIDVVVDAHVIIPVGNLEEISGSIVINGDQLLDFMGGCACSSSNNPKKVDQFVVWRGVIEVIVEITGSILEWRWVKVVTDFHGEDVDW